MRAIAVVGLGAMGSRIAQRLLSAGHEVLITMVSDPAAPRAVSEGGERIAAGADATLTVIEMSTVGPAGVTRLGSALPPGTPLLDRPCPRWGSTLLRA
jgi:3-hydroxyisobutyrate dehydrogenase-like beta-hydroxyacid dehydrogenase